jgi:hypothetical protein
MYISNAVDMLQLVYLNTVLFYIERAAPKVKSQPEDGQNIGPKHVVVFLLYY